MVAAVIMGVVGFGLGVGFADKVKAKFAEIVQKAKDKLAELKVM